MHSSRRALVGSLSVAALAVACGSSSTSSGQAASTGDGGADASASQGAQGDAASDAPKDASLDVDKAAACATTFGMGLTPAFGRFDATVVAVVPPGDNACALPNATHLVVQGKMAGAVYRMVVDVLSDQGNPDVGLYEMDGALVGGAWAEGWHAMASLDYVTTLNVHKASFVATKEADLVAKITSEIDIGAHISIFATSTSTEPDSAHLVHRNLTNQDGAIVIHPDSASPHYILLAFDEQTF